MKTRTIDKELKRYTTAAGAVLAGASAAHADIQYNTSLDLTVDTTGVALDFNGDATTDILMHCMPGTKGWFQMQNSAEAAASSWGYHYNLSFGAAINSTSLTRWETGQGTFFFVYYGGNTCQLRPLIDPGYLGFRFDPEGGSNWKYGWLHIDSVAADYSSVSYQWLWLAG